MGLSDLMLSGVQQDLKGSGEGSRIIQGTGVQGVHPPAGG